MNSSYSFYSLQNVWNCEAQLLLQCTQFLQYIRVASVNWLPWRESAAVVLVICFQFGIRRIKNKVIILLGKWYKSSPVTVNERKIFWIKGKKKSSVFKLLNIPEKEKSQIYQNGWVKDLKTTACFGMLTDELIKIYFFLNCHIVEAWWGLTEFRRDKKTDLHWLPFKKIFQKKAERSITSPHYSVVCLLRRKLLTFYVLLTSLIVSVCPTLA